MFKVANEALKVFKGLVIVMKGTCIREDIYELEGSSAIAEAIVIVPRANDV